MEKTRATAVMRELFLRKIMLKWLDQDSKKVREMWQKGIFQPLRDRLQSELVECKRTLSSNAIFIVSEEWSELDVYVKYKENGLIREAKYMILMLTAEAEGRIENSMI